MLPHALFALLGLFQGPLAEPPALPEAGKVFARVNGVEIKADDVGRLLWDWRASEVVEELVTLRMLEQAAAKEKVTVTDAELKTAYDEQLDRIRSTAPAGTDLDKALRERGFPRSRLALRVRAEALLNKLTERSFSADKFVKVATVVVKPKSEAAADVAQAIKDADGAYERLKKGEKWSGVLQSVTKEENVLRTDGFLGWRMVEVFPAAARAEIVKLKAGEFTKPVQTENGIQIFRIDGFGKDAPGREVEELRQRFVQQERPRVLQRIQGEAKIERLGG